MQNLSETQPPKTGNPFLLWIWGKLPLVVLIILLVLIGMMVAAVGAKKERLEKEKIAALKTENPGVNSVVLKLVPSTIKDRINLPGIIAPWVQLPISAEVAGKIESKRAEEGQTVSKGELLYHIDERDYEASYNAAKAAFETAESAHHRLKKLSDQQLATKSLLDAASAELEGSRASMDMAKLRWERCSIVAALPGIVNHMYVEPGQFVGVGDPVAEILQMDQVKVTVGIPESDISSVRTLQTFDVKIDALGGKVFTGRKLFLSRSADALAKLYNLDIVIDNPEHEILPDMFARVDIIKKEVDEAIQIPLYAVISMEKQHWVYVAKNGIATKRSVTLGIQENWSVEILSGLAAGETVVVIGQRDISDGQKLNILKEITDLKEI